VAIGRSEQVESELDAMIERRARQKDPDEENQLWRESVRRYNTRRREEIRVAWCECHQAQAARHRGVLEALIADNEEKARKLLAAEDRGEGAT
jgi:hypothetical protein